MSVWTTEQADRSSYGACTRLIAELVGDISELDLDRRESETLSTRVQSLEHTLLATTRLHSVTLEILDNLAFGAGVLDDTANIVLSNRYLREVIEQLDGLRLSSGRLCAARPGETREIHERIAQVVTTRRASARAMSVTRPSGLSPLLLVFAPLQGKAPRLTGQAALLYVVDPARSVTLDIGLVRALFGLTRTESRIAARLAQGMRLDQISASLGVATSTARSHLKHIFSKTRTERQADLTMLLRCLLGSLRV